MIHRLLSASIKEAADTFPIVGVVGPRQSGKTTLVRALFPDYQYVSLEELDTRRFAADDPRGFLARYHNHVILDEVQRVPELFSYLQTQVDEQKTNGQYILTGSQHFLMIYAISQTLAGRIAIYSLYPLSYEELVIAGKSTSDIYTQIWKGGYPRLYDQSVSPSVWFANYIQTYLDRDISTLSQIDNLTAFEKFLHLAAGRTGQLLNFSAFGSEVGVSHNTIKAWISLLETSGIVFLLRPYFANLSKRLNKTPKLYFMDTGLTCRLLNIVSAEQLKLYPLYGSLFETYMVTEYLKFYVNRGISTDFIYFWRDQQGAESDLLAVDGNMIRLYEIKSSQTVPTDVFGNLARIQTVIPQKSLATLIYGGSENQTRTNGDVISWIRLAKNLICVKNAK